MTDAIITKKFNEWTKGKDPLAARIAIFEHIRDIHYALIPQLRDPVTGPVELLRLCAGQCGPKHILLGTMFGSLGIPVKYATFIFSWNDPAIQYPPELRALVQKMPMGGHLACRAQIGGKWILVDATFDPVLKKLGFPVTEQWDGVSDTVCAVRGAQEVLHDTLEDRVAYDAKFRSAFTEGEKAAYAAFTPKLNAWLAAART